MERMPRPFCSTFAFSLVCLRRLLCAPFDEQGPEYNDDSCGDDEEGDDTSSSSRRWHYTSAIDIWALGCLMAEITEGRPLIPGDSDLDQLDKIQQLLGPLPEALMQVFRANHPGGITLDQAHGARADMETPSEPLRSHLSGKKWDDPHQVDFLVGMLRLDPQQRLSAESCIAHPYLSSYG